MYATCIFKKKMFSDFRFHLIITLCGKSSELLKAQQVTNGLRKTDANTSQNISHNKKNETVLYDNTDGTGNHCHVK